MCCRQSQRSFRTLKLKVTDHQSYGGFQDRWVTPSLPHSHPTLLMLRGGQNWGQLLARVIQEPNMFVLDLFEIDFCSLAQNSVICCLTLLRAGIIVCATAPNSSSKHSEQGKGERQAVIASKSVLSCPLNTGSHELV